MIFWLGCVPTRYLIAKYQLVPKLVAVAVGGWWVLGYQTNEAGFFGGPAWWADYRKYHGALWLGYGLSGRSELLFADLGLGIFDWFKNSK